MADLERTYLHYILTGDEQNLRRSLQRAEAQAAKTERTLDKAGTTAQHSGKKAAEGGKGFGKLGSALGSLGGLGKFGVAAAGLGGLAFGIKDVVSAGQQWQGQQAQLQNALKATGNASGENMRKMNEAIDRLALHGGFAPPEAVQTMTQLVRATGSVTKAIKAQELATNIARGTHKDFLQVAKAVAMVEQGRTTGLSRLGIVLPKVTLHQDALKRAHAANATTLQTLTAAGVKFTAAQKAQFALSHRITPEMVAQAKAQDAQATKLGALTRLQQLYGGSATAFSKTSQGAISNVHNALDILNQRLGQVFLPMITKVAQVIGDGLGVVIKWVDGHQHMFKGLGEAISGVWKQAQPAFRQLGQAINAIVPAVKNAVAFLAPVIRSVGSVFSSVFGGVVQAARGALQIIKGLFTLDFGQIWTGAQNIVVGAFRILTAPIRAFWNLVSGIFGKLTGVLTWPFKQLIGAVKDALKWLNKLNPFNGPADTAAGRRKIVAAQRAHGFASGFGGRPVPLSAIAHRASGGYVGGPGSGRDTVPAMLSPGEFVLQSKVVDMVGVGALNSFNQSGHLAPGHHAREIVIPVTLKMGERVVANATTRYALAMEARR